MRLDLFLKCSRLVPRRTVAQEMCDAGAVLVNGQPGKPGRTVKPGDRLDIRERGRQKTVTVLLVPVRAPSKQDAATLYELNTDVRYE